MDDGRERTFADSWRSLTDTLLGRGRRYPEIQPGETFSRQNYGNIEELAKVVSIQADRQNVRHVHFELRLRRQDGGVFDFGSRTLGLETFADVYRQRKAG